MRSAHAHARRAHAAPPGGAGGGEGSGRSAAVGGITVSAIGGDADGGRAALGGVLLSDVTGREIEDGGMGEAGEATAGGSDEAAGRQRARGANTPWYRSKLMWGRGVIAAKRSRNSCGVKIR